MVQRKALITALDAADQSWRELTLDDGGRVLLLPYGGRVLGLFAPDEEENLLWTHPALNAPATAKDFYRRDGWPNCGGDRTWLAPEGELFIADLSRAWETYRVPEALDPGDYHAVETDGSVRLVNRFTAKLLHAQRSVGAEITRGVSPALNPLRHHHDLCADVRYAGYTLHVTLRLQTSDPSIRLGIWNLVQMPHGGELRVATYGRASPCVQFGEVAAADLATESGLLRYRMTAGGIQKIGLHAPSVTGRAGYLYKTSDAQSTLLVRNFHVNPSGCYVDAPWDDLAAPGYAFQVCNVSTTELGSFSELEHHAPIAAEGDARVCADTSQLWAFRGPASTIETISDRLLGASLHSRKREDR